MPNQFPDLHSCTVAIIGLGYVGLPLAVELAKVKRSCVSNESLNHKVIGFDINVARIEELNRFYDGTNEVSESELRSATLLSLTSDPSCLSAADVFIITVPTPIDNANRPYLKPIETASVTVGKALSERVSSYYPIVIYESTVFPGATEEVCVPILKQMSGLEFNKDFFCGYSPERINPGDSEHKLTSIMKVTSGSSIEAASWINDFYASIVEAGTHLAPNIMVAEAAKVIENTQRDLNIALINELAIIFQKIGIDTLDVLEASSTKWNFLNFKPGLVGGHCIGVDPYYLTHKAELLGYHPQVVLAGRRINDHMSHWIAERIILEMAQKNLVSKDSAILVLGLTFKENCPDLRNTKVVSMIEKLKEYNLTIDVVDPYADVGLAQKYYSLDIRSHISFEKKYSCVVAAVAHNQFLELQANKWSELLIPSGIFFDLKGIIPRSLNPSRI